MALDQTRLEAWRAVIDVHASLTRSLEEALREADLPPVSWFNVLWTLDQAPDKRLRMTQLAGYLNLSRGGLTKMVDRLEGAGLIGRVACSGDRRGYHAALLPTGASMLAKMWPVYEAELERHLSAALSDAEAEAIRDALVRATQSSCTVEGAEPDAAPTDEPVGASAPG